MVADSRPEGSSPKTATTEQTEKPIALLSDPAMFGVEVGDIVRNRKTGAGFRVTRLYGSYVRGIELFRP